MEKFSIDNWVAIITLFVTLFGAGLASYMKLNTRVTEFQKDNSSLRKEFDEHKVLNREDIEDIKDLMRQTEEMNRKDHREIMLEIAKLMSAISGIRGELKNDKNN